MEKMLNEIMEKGFTVLIGKTIDGYYYEAEKRTDLDETVQVAGKGFESISNMLDCCFLACLESIH